MIHYIIDGNNLIGKISLLKKIQAKDKQSSREKLAFMLENYFRQKKAKVTLHLDGFENEPIRRSQIKIIYSEKRTADEKIKKEIELAKNRKLITVITSDNNLREFARVCGCGVIPSEKFGEELSNKNGKDEEKKKVDEMKNENEFFKRLFDAED